MDYRIEGQRLYIDGSPVSMFSGSFQYWRVRPELWADILEKVKSMGFTLIETYMPWSVHEESVGLFEFGESDPQRDLPRFLRLCKKAGVGVLARPGPHINAEMTYFGYPGRLFADDDLACRAADGSTVWLPPPPRAFPVPCYHHPRFLAEVRTYFEALSAAIGGMIHPEGSIVAIQVDNECSKFFRTHPFDHDYSDHSIRLYRRFLSEKYGEIDALNEAYVTGYAAWSLIDPPREFRPFSREELPYYLDWVEYGEYYINESLHSIASIINDCFGKGFPLFHNYPVTLPAPPFDMTSAEEFLDWQGIDSYPTRKNYEPVRAGVKYTSAASRLPMLVEFSSGSIYYSLPLTLDDQRFTTWAAVMHGIKGINFYMIVERERWYGSPVKRDGTLRERHYEFYTQFLREVRSWGLEDARPYRPVLLLLNREYERLAAAAMVLKPISMLVAELVGAGFVDALVQDDPFGLTEPVASRYKRLSSFWYQALSAAGVHFAVGDTAWPSELLSGYEMVIVPTFEFLARDVQERLLSFARGGGTLVVGPRAPFLDERMNEFRLLADAMREPSGVKRDAEVFGVRVEELLLFGDGGGEQSLYRAPVGDGALIHSGLVPGEVRGLEDALPFVPLVDTLTRMAGLEPRWVPADHKLDVAVWSSVVGELAFVANPTGKTVETELSHAGAGPFKDMRTGEELGGGAAVAVSLEPYSIRVIGKA